MTLFSRRALMQVGAGGTVAAAAAGFGFVRPAAAQVADAYAIMSADKRFSNWVQLIDAGGLQVYARGTAPFTVIVPTDTAFAQHPEVLRTLLSYQTATGNKNANLFPDSSTIVKLVRSHVVAGKHTLAELAGDRMTMTSVAGTPIEVVKAGVGYEVSWVSAFTGSKASAHVVDAPIIASNAVIYPVDAIDL